MLVVIDFNNFLFFDYLSLSTIYTFFLIKKNHSISLIMVFIFLKKNCINHQVNRCASITAREQKKVGDHYLYK